MTRIRVPNPYNRQDEGDPERDLEQWHREATQTRTYIREFPTIAEIERTITVVRDNDKYENIARKHGQVAPGDVQLNDHEMASLVKEADHSFSEKGMRIVLASIGLSAFLQGFVQSSQNGANLFEHLWGIDRSEPDQAKRRVGIANAVVYWSAALIGCQLAVPVNARYGRRGAVLVAATTIFASSLGSALIPLDTDPRKTNAWAILSGIRVINGLGMGIKAVSVPILAAEMSVGLWRGTSLVMWQLWVAFGIMISFLVNLIIHSACDDTDDGNKLKVRLILVSPIVPAALLAWLIRKVPESPRYHLTPDTRHYDPEKAFTSLLRVRNTRFQAVRDLYLTWVGIKEEMKMSGDNSSANDSTTNPESERTTRNPQPNSSVSNSNLQGNTMPENGNPNMSTVPTAGNESGRNLPGNNNSGLQSPPQDHAASPFGSLISGITSHLAKYWAIGRRRRLRNAAIAAVTVNFCQQLSGINVLAFYAGSLFVNASGGPVDSRVEIRDAMLWSFGFGLVNFIFCLPALRWIDTVGRRGMSLLTIPGMFLTLAIATAAFNGQNTANVPFLAVFLYLHAAFYSPGLGPVPFTVAGEAFPLKYREIGASIAISTNLFFAGLLAWFVPQLVERAGNKGTLGLFSGLNVVAFLLIFFLVEETARLRLEDLKTVFEYPKWKFIDFQVNETVPWFWNWVRRKKSLDDMPQLVEVVRNAENP